MKFSGAALIWIAFMLSGMKITVLLKRHQSVMQTTLLFLRRLSSEIEFSRSGINEIIGRLASEESFTQLTFLGICNRLMSDGTDFPVAWKSALNEASLYKNEEKSKMLQLGSFLGTSDCESQVKTINLYTGFFEKYYADSEDIYNRYGKPSSLFGIFLGAAVFIILY